MADFDIKKGWLKNIEGDGLKNLMQEVFGNVSEEDGKFVSSYGIMERIEAKIVSKTVLDITTSIKDIDRQLSRSKSDLKKVNRDIKECKKEISDSKKALASENKDIRDAKKEMKAQQRSLKETKKLQREME